MRSQACASETLNLRRRCAESSLAVCAPTTTKTVVVPAPTRSAFRSKVTGRSVLPPWALRA